MIDKVSTKLPIPKNCRYCNNEVVYTSNSEIYGKEYGNGKCYLCKNCKAFVGTHTGTIYPLGTLANNELRKWRNETHLWFDKIWRNHKNSSRERTYNWLSIELNIPLHETHIGLFEIEQCKKTIELTKERLNKRKRVIE